MYAASSPLIIWPEPSFNFFFPMLQNIHQIATATESELTWIENSLTQPNMFKQWILWFQSSYMKSNNLSEAGESRFLLEIQEDKSRLNEELFQSFTIAEESVDFVIIQSKPPTLKTLFVKAEDQEIRVIHYPQEKTVIYDNEADEMQNISFDEENCTTADNTLEPGPILGQKRKRKVVITETGGFKYREIEIFDNELRRLNPETVDEDDNKYVNDKLMNLYIRCKIKDSTKVLALETEPMICYQQRISNTPKDKNHSFPKKYGLKTIVEKITTEKWMKIELLLYPVNLNNSHWICVGVFPLQSECIIYDSCTHTLNASHHRVGILAVSHAYTLLCSAYSEKFKRINASPTLEWKVDDIVKVVVIKICTSYPQQTNSYDCGLFVVYGMNNICSKWETPDEMFQFDQEHITLVRQNLYDQLQVRKKKEKAKKNNSDDSTQNSSSSSKIIPQQTSNNSSTQSFSSSSSSSKIILQQRSNNSDDSTQNSSSNNFTQQTSNKSSTQNSSSSSKRKITTPYVSEILANQPTDGTTEFTKEMMVSKEFTDTIKVDIMSFQKNTSSIVCIVNWHTTPIRINNGLLRLKVGCTNRILQFTYCLIFQSNEMWKKANIQLTFNLHEIGDLALGTEYGHMGGGEILFTCSVNDINPNNKKNLEDFVKETISFNFDLLYTLQTHCKNEVNLCLPTEKKAPSLYLQNLVTTRFYYSKYNTQSKKDAQIQNSLVESLLCFLNCDSMSAKKEIRNCHCKLYNYDGNKELTTQKSSDMMKKNKCYRIYFATTLSKL